jgi:hypothetical protein
MTTTVTMSDIYDAGIDVESSGKHRVVNLGNNKIHIRCEDPYGFWHISFDRGAPPESMRGAYTTPEKALFDVNKYLAVKKKEAILPKE